MIRRTGDVVSFLLKGRPKALLLVLLSGCAPFPVSELESIPQEPPAGISEAQRRELAPTGLRVLRARRPLVDVWLRSAVPTADPRTGKGILYGTLVPGTLIGAARIHDGAADFKGQKIAPGLYTLRYAVQPDDGDHFEVTASRDFLLLCDAVADASSGELEEKTLRKLSAQINGKKHPSVLYLTAGKGGARPRVETAPASDRTILEVDVATAGGHPLGLAIVVAGKAE